MQKVVTNCVKNIFLYPKFNFFDKNYHLEGSISVVACLEVLQYT